MDWHAQSATAIATLTSANHDPVLAPDFDPDESPCHLKLNQVVHDLLCKATKAGHGDWIVLPHRDAMDGHAAWNDLLTHCTGKNVVTVTANVLRHQLHAA